MPPLDVTWNPDLEWWEGKILLESDQPFQLYVVARSEDRRITEAARHTLERLTTLEWASRRFAAAELHEIQQSEWSEGEHVSVEDFANRLIPESVEVHESGYAELHFGDDDLFWGHTVGVRIRADGTFQEAVVEG